MREQLTFQNKHHSYLHCFRIWSVDYVFNSDLVYFLSAWHVCIMALYCFLHLFGYRTLLDLYKYIYYWNLQPPTGPPLIKKNTETQSNPSGMIINPCVRAEQMNADAEEIRDWFDYCVFAQILLVWITH